MKNLIAFLLLIVVLISNHSCEKTEPDFMNSIPKGMYLLKQVNTYYTDHVIVDTFYYDSNYEITCLERRDSNDVNRFYFENRKLKERIVSVNENDNYVSYDVSYMTDGTLAITNDTTAYLFKDEQSGYYKQLTCYRRKPFAEWEESYLCEYNWDSGNLSSASVNRVLTHFNYDDKPNPMEGYVVWGFFADDLFMGTSNNRFENGYKYVYNGKNYPVGLTTSAFFREYIYY